MEYELKTFPRLTGKYTKVIITNTIFREKGNSAARRGCEDAEGIPWYPDTSRSFLARVDPQTGVVKEWTMPDAISDRPGGGTDIKFNVKKAM